MTIKKPIVTEKTIALYKKFKRATFEVDIDVNKIEAAKAVEGAYGVKVLGVTVTNRLGKYRINRLSRKLSKGQDRKIMTFKLSDKDKIEIFEA